MEIQILFALGVLWFLVYLFKKSNNEDLRKEERVRSAVEALRAVPPLEIRKVPFRLPDDGPRVQAIELRGRMPVTRPQNVSFVISVIDYTEFESTDRTGSRPVLCLFETLQEAETRAFQFQQDGPLLRPGAGSPEWIRVGFVPPDLLIPSHGGRRNLYFICRVIDTDNPPSIVRGFCDSDQSGVIAELKVSHRLDFSGTGYEEAKQARDEGRAVAIELGLAIAMADGTMHDAEGYAIKHWVERAVKTSSDEEAVDLKRRYNKAMRDGFRKAQGGTLSIEDSTARIKELADERAKYDAFQLCADVMTADGEASGAELRMIRRLGRDLSLATEEVDRILEFAMRDVGAGAAATLEELLGIPPDLTDAQRMTWIRKEYDKWSNRLTLKASGRDREYAQRKVDLLVEARQQCVARIKNVA